MVVFMGKASIITSRSKDCGLKQKPEDLKKLPTYSSHILLCYMGALGRPCVPNMIPGKTAVRNQCQNYSDLVKVCLAF